MSVISERQVAEIVACILEESEDMCIDVSEDVLSRDGDDEAEGVTIDPIGTFESLGIMTQNAGFVVQVGDSEFQITVVRSK